MTPRRIVLTRVSGRNEPWRLRPEAAGVPPLLPPLIRHEAVAPPADFRLADWDWILFTSPQAVSAFYDGPLAAELPSAGARLGVLGPGTRAELESRGGHDDLGVDARDGVELARAFLARVAPPARVLLPGAARRMREPVDILADAGFTVRDLPLYATLPVPPAELPADPFLPGDVVVFASPSTVSAFRGAWPVAAPDCVAIGETTAAAARDAGLDPAVAERPDLESLCRAVGLDLDASPNTPERAP